MAEVTIIVVNYNTKKFIELCLKSIVKNTIMPYRVIAVDNGSSDGSMEYLLRVSTAYHNIHVVRRNAKLSAVEHGRAIDQILYTSRIIKTPLVCTIDSDAYAAKKGWLAEVNEKRGNAFAAGYEHFRDSRCLHPACMLFDYKKLLLLGRPSFALAKRGGRFLDTGIMVSERALEYGEMLVGIKNMQELVPHRWCATRIQKVNGDERLDGNFTKSEFDEVNEKWFSKPEIINIMQK